jgi:hypothetical protein
LGNFSCIWQYAPASRGILGRNHVTTKLIEQGGRTIGKSGRRSSLQSSWGEDSSASELPAGGTNQRSLLPPLAHWLMRHTVSLPAGSDKWTTHAQLSGKKARWPPLNSWSWQVLITLNMCAAYRGNITSLWRCWEYATADRNLFTCTDERWSLLKLWGQLERTQTQNVVNIYKQRNKKLMYKKC